jgi:type IX secretion system PorP/SprF family membrane protein
MDLRVRGGTNNRILLIVLFIFSFCVTKGQQTPLNSISYWVFVPYVYNPAMVGSKDYLSIGINAAFQGESNSQLLSGNARISKTSSGYFLSPGTTEYKNFGIGGAVYKDIYGLSRSMGISGSVSYQIPLNRRRLSFLSIGVSVKESYNTISSDTLVPKNSLKKTYYPNFDLGIYYYGTNFFAGISSVNILGSPWKPDTLGVYKVPVSKQYFFTAGYKFLLSKSLNIVLEPSVLVSATDSTFNKIKDNINPILKLYLQDFCFGSSYHSDGEISFFAQFRYPRFYIGAFYELPQKTAYFKKSPIVEFTLGLNIQHEKSRFPSHTHW